MIRYQTDRHELIASKSSALIFNAVNKTMDELLLGRDRHLDDHALCFETVGIA
jgi:hypothetical protein